MQQIAVQCHEQSAHAEDHGMLFVRSLQKRIVGDSAKRTHAQRWIFYSTMSFIQQCPPLGDTIRDLYNHAASSATN